MKFQNGIKLVFYYRVPVFTGSSPNRFLKTSDKMALIGESAGKCDLRKGKALIGYIHRR